MSPSPEYDAVIIGSGFGGALTAHELVRAGWRVLMLERGDAVPRGPANWEADGSLELTPFYSKATPYEVERSEDRSASRLDALLTARAKTKTVGGYYCVGGPSVFYGAVSLRLRVEDFRPSRGITEGSGAEWPYDYDALEPFYSEAETVLGVAGQPGVDPTEPPRSGAYPGHLNELSETSRMIAAGAEHMGLKPFRLPLAIDYRGVDGREPCQACTTCDTFACAIGAKNDIATRVLPGLLEAGLELRSGAVVTRLHVGGSGVREVEYVQRSGGQRTRVRAREVVVAAGALATPHLLLSSGLEQLNPGGDVVGRFLTRHCNAIVFGLFRRPVNPRQQFHKQLGFHDYYFGHPTVLEPAGKLGGIQQLHSPPVGLVKSYLPPGLSHLVGGLLIPRTTGLLVMAEDTPHADNRLTLDDTRHDEFGLPQARIRHRYSDRDLAARDALLGKARQILQASGALWCYSHHIHTFSHAAGTVRMGVDPTTSALDEFGRFRGVDNLRVVDASVLPSGGGVNPSLTVAANALRVGRHMTASSGQ